MGTSNEPTKPSQPATETQKPTHIPDSQGPGTVDTSKNAGTVQEPKK
jgi:hypothetical protein